MNPNKTGMIFGSFVGDALALGPHWVYNTNVIDKKFGRVQRYFDPLVRYHAGKKKGDFTHYGDQMLLLLAFLADISEFDSTQFAKAWQSFFNGYEGYRDKATLTTLQNMAKGNSPPSYGSFSDELAGAARIAPIVYRYADDLDTALHTARQQTALTHNNPDVLDSAAFFVRLAFRALAGEKPSAAIPYLLENIFQDTDIADALYMGMASKDKDTRTVIEAFGQMCSVETALPGTIHLITKYENDFRDALVENVMAGGDSAARGMLVGMILGAYAGIEAIPEDWLETLNTREKITDLLLSLDKE